MCGLLGGVLELQELEIGLPEAAPATLEELNEAVTAHIGLGSNDQCSQNPLSPGQRSLGADVRIGRGGKRNPAQARFDAEAHQKQGAGRRRRTNPLAPICPGRGPASDDPVGPLMHLAVTRPEGVLRVDFRPRCRGRPHGSAELAARRAWEERRRAEERRRDRAAATGSRVEE